MGKKGKRHWNYFDECDMKVCSLVDMHAKCGRMEDDCGVFNKVRLCGMQ